MLRQFCLLKSHVCKRVRQDELQTLRNETSDERDRLNDDISTLTNTCSEQSAEIQRLNSQLEANTAALQVKRQFKVLPIQLQ